MSFILKCLLKQAQDIVISLAALGHSLWNKTCYKNNTHTHTHTPTHNWNDTCLQTGANKNSNDERKKSTGLSL